MQTQHERFRRCGHSTNSAMTSRQVRQHCQLDAEATGYLEQAMEEMVSRPAPTTTSTRSPATLADLAGSINIRPQDILEAIQYRSLDRKLFS